jgi:hypothetical protein
MKICFTNDLKFTSISGSTWKTNLVLGMNFKMVFDRTEFIILKQFKVIKFMLNIKCFNKFSF